jgi:hypothetical protein
MDNKVLSPALQIVKNIWDNSNHPKMGSMVRFNTCLGDALDLAIKGLIPFEIDDFEWISKNLRRFPWGAGNSDNYGENYYSLACDYGNTSAARAFEKWKNRKPFIWKWEVHHRNVERSNDRLAVGDIFNCRAKKLTVTSFDDKTGKIICCIYKERLKDNRGWEIGVLKVDHIYKLTGKELKALADTTMGAPDLENIHGK